MVREMSQTTHFVSIVALALISIGLTTPVQSPAEAELARKLANPVASLISVPIQANYDGNIGSAEEGSVWRINIQPVIPFALTENWNFISRTIPPVIDQQDIPGAGSGVFGDIDQRRRAPHLRRPATEFPTILRLYLVAPLVFELEKIVRLDGKRERAVGKHDDMIER